MDRTSGWGHQGGTGRDVELEVHGADRQHGARPEGGGGAHGLAVQGRGRPMATALTVHPPATDSTSA